MCIFLCTITYKLVLQVLSHFEKGFFPVWSLDLSLEKGRMPDNFPTFFIIRLALSPVGSLVPVQVSFLQKHFLPQLKHQLPSLLAEFAPGKG